MPSVEENRDCFSPIRRFVSTGDMNAARDWLIQNKSSLQDFEFFLLYQAICADGGELTLWERCIAPLKKIQAYSELLFVLERAADVSRRGGDGVRFRLFLKQAEEISQYLGNIDQHLQYVAIYANQLFLDGYIEQAQELLQQVVVKAQETNNHLLLLAQGTILSGILLNQQKWMAAASLSVMMEEAARIRQNWIGVSCAVMTRATVWHSQGQTEASIRLLLEHGRKLHEQGAIAALNLIKARLAEMKSLIGDEEFQRICSLL